MKKILVTKDDFRLMENPAVEYYGIQILHGKYKDVIFTFGEVRLTEQENKCGAQVNFDFRVEQGNKKYTVEELKKEIHFKNYISEILSIILEEWEPHNNDEHTTTDSEESM